MTPEQFRGSYAWKQARRRARKGATHCALCHRLLRDDVGPRHPLAPSVDHVVPLASLDLATAQGRALAVDQGLLRVVHVGCNAGRGARASNARRVPPVASAEASQVVSEMARGGWRSWRSEHWTEPAFDVYCPCAVCVKRPTPVELARSGDPIYRKDAQ